MTSSDDLTKALLIALKLLEKRTAVEKLEEKYDSLNREVGNLYHELEELKERGVSNEPK